MSMGSWKSPLYSSDSSWRRAFLAITEETLATIWETRVYLAPTFECLLHVDSLLRTGLEVRDPTLGLAESHCPLRCDLSTI